MNVLTRHILQIKLLARIYIYTVVWCRCPRWCGVGVLGGVVSVSSVVVAGVLGGIYPAEHQGGHAQSSSVRRSVSLPNQGFGVEFTDAIALIINYLGSPFGRAFAE